MINKFRFFDIFRNTTSTTTTTTTTINPSDPIIPEGFGALAGGANTGNIYHVTTLSGTGPGSFSYGLGRNGGSSPTGKTIVFDVAGTITCTNEFQHTISSGNNFTIDGTTAPYPGVTIVNPVNDDEANGLSIGGSCHHIIIKGLAFRDCVNDGLNVIEGANNILITNCLVYGCGDGNLDVAAITGQNITVQWCIIGNHKQEIGDGDGAGGTLVTSRFVTIHHNLFFPISPNPDEGERFPFVHANYSPAALPNADVRNNLIYNYGRNNGSGSGFGIGVGYGANTNNINNYIRTISSSDALQDGISLDIDGEQGFGYSSGNVSGNGINFNATSRYTNRAEISIPAQYQVAPESACAAASRILAKAGMTQRNPVGGTRRPDEAAYINGVTLPLPGC